MDHYDMDYADTDAETKSRPQPISVDKNEEPPLLNTKALSEHAETYELEKFEKNILIIFNQNMLEGYQEPRLGTEKDVEALRRTFSKFGFEVVEHLDLTKKEIEDELKAYNQKNFRDYGCVAVAVLTHGSDYSFLRAKDQKYSEEVIINHLKPVNNLTLVTKPKIIIIQACRGSMTVPGVAVFQEGTVARDCDEPNKSYTIPPESDMLILHSSYSGNPSYRDKIHGSFFIQELCNKIDSRAATEDLLSISTEVNRAVAINKQHEEYNRRTKTYEINKQTPVVTSTLTRKLYLRKFCDATVAQSSSDSCVIVETHARKQGDRGTAYPTSTLLSAAERKAYLFLSNVKLGTTTEHVLEYLRDRFPTDTCTVTIENPNYDGYASFKLCVPFRHQDEYLSPTNWPEDIVVKMYPTDDEIYGEMLHHIP